MMEENSFSKKTFTIWHITDNTKDIAFPLLRQLLWTLLAGYSTCKISVTNERVSQKKRY